MATSKLDKKENHGLRAKINKNFGRDENGNGFIPNVLIAPLDFMSWYTRDDEASPFAFMGTALATMLVIAGVDEYRDVTSNVQPTSYEVTDTAAPDAISTVYNLNGKLYLLRDTDEGVQLYTQADFDDSKRDDYFTLVAEHEAPAIARNIASIYKGIVEQQNGHVDIYSNFESVRANEPAVMQYEGITGVFTFNSDGDYYIMADNVNEELNERWEASAQTAIEGQQAWEAALTEMAAGSYINHEQGLIEGPSANEVNYNYWLMYAQAMGALAGLGTAIGAGASIASSRRRFKYQNNL